jgi:hypothetical protein
LIDDQAIGGPEILPQPRQLADERVEDAAPLHEARGAQLRRARRCRTGARRPPAD